MNITSEFDNECCGKCSDSIDKKMILFSNWMEENKDNEKLKMINEFDFQKKFDLFKKDYYGTDCGM